jgi:hypothetical protein
MSDSNRERVRGIIDKLSTIRARRLACFGSDKHRFRLNPPLADATVRAFEAEHRIQVPDDYRAFLTQAGNGGAGPYYGIFPLEAWSDFADWVLDQRPDNFLARPCPLRPEMKANEWTAGFHKASRYQGSLSLGSRGCAYATQLVVSGPYAGRVVYVDADGGVPYMVRDADFLSWYERWLDELLQGYDTAWFGYGPGGGEDDFFRILDDPKSSDDLKAEAAGAFCRLPRLSDAGAARLAAYLVYPLAGVRCGACATIRHFRIDRGAEEAAQLLGDPSAEVRREAVRTAMELDPQRWADAVLCRLREDPDEEVATAAFFKLKDAGALSKLELLRIVEGSPSGRLRGLAAYQMQWSSEDIGLLIRMLSDANSQVRLTATLGLRQLEARSSLPQLLELLSGEKDDFVIGALLKVLGEFADPSAAASLLDWATSEDDFHRLDAIEALAKIGDPRGLPIAKIMLAENREPVRRDANGLSMHSSVYSISDLTRKAVQASPHATWRALAKRRWLGGCW